MNVISLELSKKLYEVSGWSSSDYYYDSCELVTKEVAQGENHEPECEVCPAYDSGYILRKLPRTVDVDDPHVSKGSLYMSRGDVKEWQFGYELSGDLWAEADTPEDALAKLAIELFEQGILTKA